MSEYNIVDKQELYIDSLVDEHESRKITGWGSEQVAYDMDTDFEDEKEKLK